MSISGKRAPPLENPQLYLPYIQNKYTKNKKANQTISHPQSQQSHNQKLSISKKKQKNIHRYRNTMYVNPKKYPKENFRYHKSNIEEEKSLEFLNNSKQKIQGFTPEQQTDQNYENMLTSIIQEERGNKLNFDKNISYLKKSKIKKSKKYLDKSYQKQKNSPPKKLKAISLARKNNNYIFQSAKQAFLNKKFKLSAELFSKFLSHFKSPRALDVEAYYLFGLSLINIGQLKDGISYLEKIIDIDPKYEKSIYLTIAKGYEELDKINDSIIIFSIGIKHYPNFYKFKFLRGKLYAKKKFNQDAIKDFDASIALNQQLGDAYYEKCLILKAQNKIQQMIETVNQGIETNRKYDLIQLRGKCYFQIGNFKNSAQDFEQCANIHPRNSNLHYLKGLSEYNLGNNSLAFASFQQSIKRARIQIKRKMLSNSPEDNPKNGEYNPEKVLVYSYQLILHMQITQKQFRQAFDTIKILSKQVDSEFLQNCALKQWKLLIEGVIHQIKRQYVQSLNKLNELLEAPLFNRQDNKKHFECILSKRNKQRYRFIKPLAYIYRAFAKMELTNIKEASEDYDRYKNICKAIGQQPNDISFKYNTLIIESRAFFPRSTKILEQASSLIPLNAQPYLFLAFEEVQNNLSILVCAQDAYNKPKISLLKQLNSSNVQPTLSSVKTTEGPIFSEPILKSLKKINSLIEKSISIFPKFSKCSEQQKQFNGKYLAQFYYYAAIVKLYEQQLDSAQRNIKLSIDLSKARLFEQIWEDHNQVEKLKSNLTHYFLNNFARYYYVNGLILALKKQYSGAVGCFNIALELGPKKDFSLKKIYLQKAKCLKLTGKGQQALQSMYQYIQLAPEDSKIHEYLGILLFENFQYQESLNTLKKIEKPAKNQKVLLIQAKCHFMCNNFKLAYDLLKEYEQNSKRKRHETDLQIIQIFADSKTGHSEQNLRLYIRKLLRITDLISIKTDTQDNLFKIGQIQQLRGCFYMLLDQYEKAIEYYEKSLTSLKIDKSNELSKLELFQKKKKQSSQQVMFAQQYIKKQYCQKWNIREIQLLYNIAISYLCMKLPSKAIQVLEQALEINYDFEENQLDFMLELANRIKIKNLSVTKRVQLKGLGNKCISDNWPLIKITGYQIFMPLAFSHPFVEPPQFLPEFDIDLFANFTISSMPIKADPPWLKRQKIGFVYTDNIDHNESIEIDESSEESLYQIPEILKQDEYDM